MRRALSEGNELSPSPTRRRVSEEAQGALRRGAEDKDSHAAKLPRTDKVNHVSDAKHKYFYDDLEVVVDEDVDLLESWEIDDETNDLLEFDEMSFRERSEGEGPPELEAYELEALDAKATVEEVDRLRQIGVIDSADGHQEPEDLVFLDTTNVFDWRYRDGRWKRRCRIVAREYKTNQTTIEEFSPTSNMFVLKLLMVLAQLHGLMTFVADVKDAFLTVPQKNPVWVKVPSWVRGLAKAGDVLLNSSMWRLLRCLPGQRNAALMWSNYFKDLMVSEDFECFVGMPTVFRHKVRKIFLTIHVDDILLVCSEQDGEWFKSITTSLTMKTDGPYRPGSGDMFYYLKKRWTLLAQGVFVQPNPSYIHKMIELLELQRKKDKALPHHATLEVFGKSSSAVNDFLNEAEQKKFRSGLGLALYIAQDRPDIQQAVKVLSTYMAGGTHLALAGLRHLGCYLAGTADYGVLLPNTELFALCCDVERRAAWENRRDRSAYNVEGYADANWGCKVSRRSTTSFMIKCNGCLLMSSCKLQTTIAMSSAESELYAASSCAAEMVQIGLLLKFLVMDTFDFGSKDQKVRLKLYSDSSSARAISQRLGQGKVKHLDIRYLWIQEMVRRKVFTVHRVGTVHNVSDLNTKKLSLARRRFLMGLIPMARGNETGYFELIVGEDDVEKKKVLRIVMSMINAASCSLSLQGCHVAEGCKNPWSVYMIMFLPIAVIVFLLRMINKLADHANRFRIAAKEVRRLLRQRGCPEDQSEEVSSEVERACVEWFGEREEDGYRYCQEENTESEELEDDPRDIVPTRDIFGTEEEWNAYCAAARNTVATPRRRTVPADESAGIPSQTPLSAADENTFGAVSEEDLTNLPPHLREQAIAFLERIPEGGDEFYQFRYQMIGHDMGPESFLTRQAAFVMQRIVLTYMSWQMNWSQFTMT